MLLVEAVVDCREDDGMTRLAGLLAVLLGAGLEGIGDLLVDGATVLFALVLVLRRVELLVVEFTEPLPVLLVLAVLTVPLPILFLTVVPCAMLLLREVPGFVDCEAILLLLVAVLCLVLLFGAGEPILLPLLVFALVGAGEPVL